MTDHVYLWTTNPTGVPKGLERGVIAEGYRWIIADRGQFLVLEQVRQVFHDVPQGTISNFASLGQWMYVREREGTYLTQKGAEDENLLQAHADDPV